MSREKTNSRTCISCGETMSRIKGNIELPLNFEGSESIEIWFPMWECPKGHTLIDPKMNSFLDKSLTIAIRTLGSTDIIAGILRRQLMGDRKPPTSSVDTSHDGDD